MVPDAPLMPTITGLESPIIALVFKLHHHFARMHKARQTKKEIEIRKPGKDRFRLFAGQRRMTSYAG
jgi:hypothetical protein